MAILERGVGVEGESWSIRLLRLEGVPAGVEAALWVREGAAFEVARVEFRYEKSLVYVFRETGGFTRISGRSSLVLSLERC
jgi:hypothetical protein